MSFIDTTIEARLGEGNRWVKLAKVIDWQRIEEKLVVLRRAGRAAQGRRNYGYLKMFKAVLLGQWHGLSDPELEDALRVRMDFLWFCGFDLNGGTPDETTLCRFRNLLVKKGLLEPLLEEINRQLEELGLKLKASSGAVIDATVISAAARPRRVIEMAEDRQEEGKKPPKKQPVQMSESADGDARWLCKGKRFYFGYKGFIRVDSEQGFIEKATVTPANAAEIKQLEPITQGLEKGRRLMADKAYASKAARQTLKTRGIKDGLMHKAARNRPLRPTQRRKNRLISRQRFRVEQCFGTLKRRFHMARTSYFGTEKVLAQLHLKAICHNLLKASNLVTQITPQTSS